MPVSTVSESACLPAPARTSSKDAAQWVDVVSASKHMLPKNRRLPRQMFLQTKKTGFVIHTQLFTAIGVKTQFPARLSVVVSTKVHKSAVRRNHLRRKIYSLLADIFSDNINLIIYPNKSALNSNDEKINFEINSLIPKISVL